MTFEITSPTMFSLITTLNYYRLYIAAHERGLSVLTASGRALVILFSVPKLFSIDCSAHVHDEGTPVS